MTIAQLRAHIAQAHQIVSDLCHHKIEWKMHIPAQPETDPDLVIGRALRHADKLLDVAEAAKYLEEIGNNFETRIKLHTALAALEADE